MADQITASGPKPSSRPSPLARFPQSVRDANERFLATGDLADLDTVVLAVVQRFQPAATELPDSARMVGDLGFDSLALAEIVFFLEDLYDVSVSNEELMGLTTIGELRAFIHVKIPARPSA